MQLLCSCSYREFFQQDDEYRFEETGKDQMIDPGLDKMAGGFVDVGVILVLNLGISELVVMIHICVICVYYIEIIK